MLISCLKVNSFKGRVDKEKNMQTQLQPIKIHKIHNVLPSKCMGILQKVSVISAVSFFPMTRPAGFFSFIRSVVMLDVC